MKHNISMCLIHWPVLDRAGSVIATNVTNFDIHDIARSARTYGLQNYFFVNRLHVLLMFVERVLQHWKVGAGSRLNPTRKKALGKIQTAETIEDVLKRFPKKPYVVATAARQVPTPQKITFKDLRAQIKSDPQRPILVVFGTGFGLTQEFLDGCDALLEPISGASEDGYNHLSVRSAVAICLDRLLGQW